MRRRRVQLLALIGLFAQQGCGAGDREVPRSPPSDSAPVSGSSSSLPLQSDSTVLRGPRIIVDSLITEPRLEKAGGEFLVRLPAVMARLMYDTIPRFVPMQQPVPVPRGMARDSSWSVVVGDFDGNSRADVAMMGPSSATDTALFMLLSPSSTAPVPRIVFIEPATPPDPRPYILRLVRPRKFVSPDNDEFVLDLRTDAIHLRSEIVSTICYLDNGEIRWFSLAGD